MRTVRFCRSTKLVETSSATGSPKTGVFSVLVTFGGL
jgi:hypothetical protein